MTARGITSTNHALAKSANRPYERAHVAYERKGWRTIPVDLRKTGTTVPGVTGYEGRDPSSTDVKQYVARYPEANVGIVMPPTVVAIDVDLDVEGGKDGIDTYWRIIDDGECGPFPSTYSNGHGDEESAYRHYFYRVPDDVTPEEVAGLGAGHSGIDVLRWMHRWSRVSPSVHSSGETYYWLDPNGDVCKAPRPGDLPQLTREHWDYLCKVVGWSKKSRYAAAAVDVEEWLAEHDSEPDEDVRAAVRAHWGRREGLEAVERHGSRHAGLVACLLALAHLGEEGHGVSKAVRWLEQAFYEHREDHAEFARALESAIGQAVAKSDIGVLYDEETGEPLRFIHRGGREEIRLGRSRPDLDVTSLSGALEDIKRLVGQGALSGVFLRSGLVVFIPRVGEEGYVPPREGDDGPAQVQPLTQAAFAARVDHCFTVFKRIKKGAFTIAVGCLFPLAIAQRTLAAPDLLLHARDLRSVTHTPFVRHDGTICNEPGYDDSTRTLFLPLTDAALIEVSGAPTPDELDRARELILRIIADFPWVSPSDKANYLGALLTPLIRTLVSPPYRGVIITAPQRGTGKTLLADLLADIHGAVKRSEFPTSEEERSKVFAALLATTTAPVVVFDNVSGVLKSSVLDGLLTSSSLQERLLGRTEILNLYNDRLWVFTGNNVSIGGDLERRLLVVGIDANMERPEDRQAAQFIFPDLERWVREHRGEVLAALLTLVRHWAASGMPTDERPVSDSFGQWIAVIRGILASAGIGADDGVGKFGATPLGIAPDPEGDEWATFLRAVHDQFGPKPWSVKELMDALDDFGRLSHDDLPAKVAENLSYKPRSAATTLGMLLRSHSRQWADGLQLLPASQKSRKGKPMWQVAGR